MGILNKNTKKIRIQVRGDSILMKIINKIITIIINVTVTTLNIMVDIVDDKNIVPSVRWNLLPPVTLTRRAYTAT